LGLESPIPWIDLPLVDRNRHLLGKVAIDRNQPNAFFSDDELKTLKLIGYITAARWSQIEATQRTLNPAEYLRLFKKSNVLILGKDTGAQLVHLRSIQEIVCGIGYRAEIVKDAPEIPEMSNEDKVRALADSSRFVLLENSFAAGQIVEMKIMSTNRIVTAILREEGLGSSWMVSDYDIDFAFMREFVYTPDTLEEVVGAACKWAEQFVAGRVEQLARRYPWRAPSMYPPGTGPPSVVELP
jgi:hypothetical protein